jgi:hypothetical protein
MAARGIPTRPASGGTGEDQTRTEVDKEVAWYVDHPDSPWNNERFGDYGGLPGSGGFNPWTEYEIGGARMAQEVSCIVGSIAKAVRALKWDPGDDAAYLMRVRQEQAHLEEEMSLIENDIKEYGKTHIYTDPLNDDIKRGDTSYVEGMVEDIRTQAPKLRRIAKKRREAASEHTPEDLRRVALAAYDFVDTLAEKMLESVSTYEQGYVTNAYQDVEIDRKAKRLRAAIDELWEKVVSMRRRS